MDRHAPLVLQVVQVPYNDDEHIWWVNTNADDNADDDRILDTILYLE